MSRIARVFVLRSAPLKIMEVIRAVGAASPMTSPSSKRSRGMVLVFGVNLIVGFALLFGWVMPFPTGVEYWRVDSDGVVVLGVDAATPGQIGIPQFAPSKDEFYVWATATHPWFPGVSEIGFPDFPVPTVVIDGNTGRTVPRR